MIGPPAATPSFPHVRQSRRLSAALCTVALALAAGACSGDLAPTPPDDPPSLACPVGMTATSPDGQPVAVTYTTPTAVGGTAPVTVACSPASGSSFPVGLTIVSCRATDSTGRQANCAFTVKVDVEGRLSATRFLAFGDSLTEGKVSLSAPLYILADLPTSYPRHLQELLQARYAAQSPTVTNEGLGGEKAVEGVTRLPGVLRTSAPQAVLLMEGANDLNSSHAADNLEPAAQAMEAMVWQVKTRSAAAFLATLPPQRPGGSRALGAAYVKPYNDRLEAIAAATGAILVDVWAGLGGPAASAEYVGTDGLHLTAKGYEKVAEIFDEAIRAHLEVRPSQADQR